jgi:hypothetical protein
LIEPPGFWDSSFSNSRHLPVSIFVTSTIGVLPIRSSGDFTVALRAGAVRDIVGSGSGRSEAEASHSHGQLTQDLTQGRGSALRKTQ